MSNGTAMPDAAQQRSIVVAPSILSADFGRPAEEVRAVDAAQADWTHVDVMDGRLERVPIKWNHLIDKDAAQNQRELEHVRIEKVEQLFWDML